MRKSKNCKPSPVDAAAARVLGKLKEPVDNRIAVRIAKDFMKLLAAVNAQVGHVSAEINTVEEDTVRGAFSIDSTSFEIHVMQNQGDDHCLLIGNDDDGWFEVRSDDPREILSPGMKGKVRWDGAFKGDRLTDYLSTVFHAHAEGFCRPGRIRRLNLTL